MSSSIGSVISVDLSGFEGLDKVVAILPVLLSPKQIVCGVYKFSLI